MGYRGTTPENAPENTEKGEEMEQCRCNMREEEPSQTGASTQGMGEEEGESDNEGIGGSNEDTGGYEEEDETVLEVLPEWLDAAEEETTSSAAAPEAVPSGPDQGKGEVGEGRLRRPPSQEEPEKAIGPEPEVQNAAPESTPPTAKTTERELLAMGASLDAVDGNTGGTAALLLDDASDSEMDVDKIMEVRKRRGEQGGKIRARKKKNPCSKNKP